LTMRRTFPAISPTVGLIWARPTFIGQIIRFRPGPKAMYQEINFHCKNAWFPIGKKRNRPMRYWIYWNDLVQGPFELEELISLNAFSEDLLVCMEDRQEWLPACRVADLAPSIELLKSRRMPPLPPPPPPPKAPASTPLQGEFFA